MKNTDKTQPKQGPGQKKPIVQPEKTKQSGEKIAGSNIGDITERKRAEEALHESKERYRLLFELSPDAIAVHRGGKVLFVNPAAARLVGAATPDELIDRQLMDFVHPDYRELVIERTRQQVVEGKTVPHVDEKFVRLDGSEVDVEVTAAPFHYQGSLASLVIFRDITGRKRAEEALRASDERFRIAAQSASDLIWEWDVVNSKLEWFGAIDALLGYAPGEFPRTIKAWEGIIHPDDHDRVMATLDQHLKTRAPYAEEYRVRRKDGTFGYWTDKGEAMWDDKGNTYKMIGVCTDITERKRAEEALRESEEMYRTLVKTSPDAVTVTNLEGNITYVSQSALELHGCERAEELLGRNAYELIALEDHKRAKATLQRTLKEGGVKDVEYTMLRKNGGRFIGQLNAALIRDAYGQPKAFIAAVRDITERKWAEEVLRESEYKFRSLFTSSRDGVAIADLRGYITDCNQAYADMLGYSMEELGKFTFLELTPEKWHKLNEVMVQRVMEQGYSNEFEKEYIRKDGTIFPVSLRTWRITDEKGNPIGICSIARDITERKQAEQALAESEIKFRWLYEYAPIAYHLLTPDGNITDVNRRWCELLGYRKEEALGKAIFEFVVEEEREAAKASFEKKKRSQQSFVEGSERNFRTKEGAVRTFKTYDFFALDEGQNITSVQTTIEDITERKQAEEALRESQQMLRSVMDTIPVRVFWKDCDSNYLGCNRSFALDAGLKSPEEILRKNDFELGWKNQAKMYRADDRAVIQSGLPKLNYEEPQTTPTGDTIWLRTSKIPLFDASGQIKGILGTYEDITERKHAEEALARQADELRRRNQELARLYRASGSLISSVTLNLQELAQTIVEIVQKEFGQANCSLLSVQKDLNGVVRLAASGPYADQTKYKNLALDGPGLVPQAIRTGEVVNTGDVHSTPGYIQGWDAAQSELTIPLKVGDNVIGAIDVQSSEPNAFSPDDERLMTIFAERAALALERGRLNAQTESRMQQLLSLRTVDMAISSSFDLDLILGVLLDQITGYLNVHAADVLIFNPTTQTFKFSGERGFRTQALLHTYLRLGESYAGRAVQERRIITIPDLRGQPEGLQRSLELSDEQFIAYVGIPLIAKGQIKGVLEIFHREALELDQDGYGFLETLASQAAIAIDNAGLFENLQISNADLTIAYDSTLEGWANALELRDKETEGHTRRVTGMATRLARSLGVKEDDLVHIYRGALLHDIGKMGVPDSIVLKPGPLTDDECAIMRKHPQYAFNLLAPITFLKRALEIPYGHHERWDGTGYPLGLKGEQIPLAARAFAVVDVWDALKSDRPYRKAWPEAKIIEYVRQQAGLYFDPAVVKIFLDVSFEKE